MNSTGSRALIVIVLITCSMLLLWWFAPKGEDRGGWLVTEVASGDTITVTREGETVIVHLLGVDAPAQGECGFTESRDHLAEGIDGVEVVLIDQGGDATRWPAFDRYVELAGRDAGLEQITTGHAVPDGSEHARTEQYEVAAKDAPHLCD